MVESGGQGVHPWGPQGGVKSINKIYNNESSYSEN